MKNRLKNGEMIEFTNAFGDLITLWFQSRTNNFCLMLNAKVIKSTKTFTPIENKLKTFGSLTELDNK